MLGMLLKLESALNKLPCENVDIYFSVTSYFNPDYEHVNGIHLMYELNNNPRTAHEYEYIL